MVRGIAWVANGKGLELMELMETILSFILFE